MAYSPPMPKLIIVSGGQTGVDRAALDAAIARGIAYGGWCPQGGWAEDCPEPPGVLARYPLLRETPSADPAQRTEWNVRDSDASLDPGRCRRHCGVGRHGIGASGWRRVTASRCCVIDVGAADAPERGARMACGAAGVPCKATRRSGSRSVDRGRARRMGFMGRRAWFWRKGSKQLYRVQTHSMR